MDLTRLWHLTKFIDWGDIPTWLGSIGTVGTLIFTLHQLNIDRNERKVNELKFQAKDVSSWIINENEDKIKCVLSNSSNAPVYTIILTLVGIQGAGPPSDGKDVPEDYNYRKIFSVLPPGKFQAELPNPGRGMCIEFGIEIGFTDVNGNSWIRKSSGDLIKINKKPTEYYKIDKPFKYDQYNEY